MNMKQALAAGLMLAATSSALAADPVVLIADGELHGMREQASDKIPNHTSYAWVNDPTQPSGKALEAFADGAASGLVREETLPFSADAVLEITYQVVEAYNPGDERTKAGDDFPLRLYLTNRSFLFHRTLVLVRSLQNEVGASWRNPYSNDIADFQMHVFATGTGADIGWQEASIPIGKLWAEAYGEVPDDLLAISLMADSDNAGGMMRTRIARLVYHP